MITQMDSEVTISKLKANAYLTDKQLQKVQDLKITIVNNEAHQ